MATRTFAGSSLATALLAAGATLALAAAGSVAMAQDSTQAESHSAHEHAGAAGEHSAAIGMPPKADVKPFESAKLSLTQAITDAQSDVRGKVLAARFEVWHGKPVYLIRSYSASQIWETRVDANTGQALGQPSKIAQSELGPQLKKEIAALESAQTSLTDAVSKAEQKEGGKAIMARVQPGTAGASYALDLVKDGRIHTAMVDTQSGELR